MSDAERWSAWIGRTMAASAGGQLGQIVDIYVDEQTNAAEWATIQTIGRGEVRFVPLQGARPEDGTLVVPWDHQVVDTAPSLPYDGALTEDDEDALYRHYGVTRSEGPVLEPPLEATALEPTLEAAVPSPADVAAPSSSPSGVAVTRSEEELRVTKVPREAGRVRLRKWVETEDVSERVPVTYEEVRVERQPITAANVDEAMAEVELADSEYELVLEEEQVVAAKVAVPKERVRMEKAVVTDEQPIEEQLRKERVVVERDPPRS